MTVLAWKGDAAEAYDKNQAVIYKGPWKEVTDEQGRRFPRGKRTAVSDTTFKAMQMEPYKNHMITIEPLIIVEKDIAFSNCCGFNERSPTVTKMGVVSRTTDPNQGSCC